MDKTAFHGLYGIYHYLHHIKKKRSTESKANQTTYVVSITVTRYTSYALKKTQNAFPCIQLMLNSNLQKKENKKCLNQV